MKPPPDRKSGNDGEAEHSRHHDRDLAAAHRRSPPATSQRRYPSLSDDGQPWFPRRRPKPRLTTKPATATDGSVEGNRPGFRYLRLLALLAFIAIVAALLANASA